MEVPTMKLKKILAPIIACTLLMTSCSTPDEGKDTSSNPATDTSSVLSLPEPMPSESTPIASEVPLTSSEMEENLEAQANVSGASHIEQYQAWLGTGN